MKIKRLLIPSEWFYREPNAGSLMRDNYNIDEATHRILCRHCCGRAIHHYSMRCIPVNRTKSGNWKIIVFGDRYWSDKTHIKRIRYVPAIRLIRETDFKGIHESN